MDDISKAVQSSMAAGFAAGDGGLESQIVGCLRSRCQKVVAQCRANNGGPCPTKDLRLQTIRHCRPVKAQIMADDAMIGACERKIDKMAKGAKTKGGYIAGAPEDFEVMMNRCLHTDAGRHPAYETCFSDTWRDLTVACALRKCGDSAATCLQQTCKIPVGSLQAPPR